MTKSLSGSLLKVTVNGFDARAQARFAMFLQGYADGVCEVVGEEQAEAAIVDLDGFGGEALWQNIRGRFRGPAVVMSVSEKRLPNTLWVRKPIRSDDFLLAIERIRQQLKAERSLREMQLAAARALPVSNVEPAVSAPPMIKAFLRMDRRIAAEAAPCVLTPTAPGKWHGIGRAASLVWNERQIHESCGALEDSVYLDPDRRDELFYDPAGYLQGVLQRACPRARETSRPVSIALGAQTIVVLGGGRQIICDAREHQLRPLSVMSSASRLATVNDLADYQASRNPSAGRQLLGSETVLWMVSLWASRGRVPKGTDLDAPVSLANWPCFSRLLVPPHSMQIASLWTSSPQSLVQTAKMLAIPHRYVFSLYSACQTLGLVNRSAAATVAAVTPADDMAAGAEKRGLLGSLLRRLRLTR